MKQALPKQLTVYAIAEHVLNSCENQRFIIIYQHKSILNQLNPFHTLTPYLSKIYINITLPSTPRNSK
jgi:hypothetical protein